MLMSLTHLMLCAVFVLLSALQSSVVSDHLAKAVSESPSTNPGLTAQVIIVLLMAAQLVLMVIGLLLKKKS